MSVCGISLESVTAEDYVAYLKHRSAVATTARASSTPGIVSNQLVPRGKQLKGHTRSLTIASSSKRRVRLPIINMVQFQLVSLASDPLWLAP